MIEGLIYLVAVVLMSFLLYLVYKLYKAEGSKEDKIFYIPIVIAIFAPQVIIYIKAIICLLGEN